MMGRRRSFLSLGMIVLMLALPWTAVADASGRGNEDETEKVKITTQKQIDQNQMKIEVEFENLTEYINYDYEINITRVDPNFIHQSYTGNFAPEEGEDDKYEKYVMSNEKEKQNLINRSISVFCKSIKEG